MTRYLILGISILIILGTFGLVLFNDPLELGARGFMPWQGGTGTSTAPTYGQVLAGDGNGVYRLWATSTLGIVGAGDGTASSTLHADNNNFTGTNDFSGLTTLGNATATQLSLTNLFISGDNITDFAGTGLSVSGTALVADLGTSIDISSETNLAATYPIILTGDTLSTAFGTNTNNTFSGNQDFNGSTVTGIPYPFSVNYGTTSWGGTTTLALGPAYSAQTWSGIVCFTDQSLINVQIGDGSSFTSIVTASTTPGKVAFSSNNTFTEAEKRFVRFGGTSTSATTEVACTLEYKYD